MLSFSSFVYFAKLISFLQRKIIIANPVFQSREAKKEKYMAQFKLSIIQKHNESYFHGFTLLHLPILINRL